MDHGLGVYEMTTFKLTSGRNVSTTDNHMMTVVKNNKVSLVAASDVKVGDVFYSFDNAEVNEDPVEHIQTTTETCKVINLITNVNIIADQVAVSIRTVGDFPDEIIEMGEAIYVQQGFEAANKFCKDVDLAYKNYKDCKTEPIRSEI